MAPPELTGNAPILDVIHPIEINLAHPLRDKLHRAITHDIDRGLCKRLHFDEPLLGNARLDRGVAAVARADIVLHRLDLDEISARLQIFDDFFAALVNIHARIFAARFCHMAVVRHHVDDFEIVPQANLKVVRVVGGRNFHHAGSEIHFHIFIRDQRDFLIDQGQDQFFAHQAPIALILRMDGHGRIAEHCFRTSGCKLNIAAAIRKRVAHMPEGAVLLCILHLRVGNRGLAMGAPIDDALTAIDQAFLIQPDKHFAHSL